MQLWLSISLLPSSLFITTRNSPCLHPLNSIPPFPNRPHIPQHHHSQHMSHPDQLVHLSFSPTPAFSPTAITLLINPHASLPATLEATTKCLTFSIPESPQIAACSFRVNLADIFIHSITESKQIYIMLETYPDNSPLLELSRHSDSIKVEIDEESDSGKIFVELTFQVHDIPANHLELTFDESFEKEMDLTALRQSPVDFFHHLFTQLIRLTPDPAASDLGMSDGDDFDLQTLQNQADIAMFTDGFYTEHGFMQPLEPHEVYDEDEDDYYDAPRVE